MRKRRAGLPLFAGEGERRGSGEGVMGVGEVLWERGGNRGREK